MTGQRRMSERRTVEVVESQIVAWLKPYLRRRTYNCVREMPSVRAALEMLPSISRMTRSIVERSILLRFVELSRSHLGPDSALEDLAVTRADGVGAETRLPLPR